MKKVLFYTASVTYHGRVWDLSSQEFRNYLITAAKEKRCLYKVEYLYDNDAYHLESYIDYSKHDETPKTAEVQWAEIDKSFDLDKILTRIYLDGTISAEGINFLQYMNDADEYSAYECS